MVNALEAMPHVKSGGLTALAVTGLKRHPALPDVPTVAEAGFPGFEAYTWWALVAPAKTPPDIVARLNQETRKAIANPKFQERLEQVGGQVTGSTPAELAAFIKNDRAKWGRIIQEAGIKAE
jgi:tripartite-type tricarboxylate transporter receptor subunit TctC